MDEGEIVADLLLSGFPPEEDFGAAMTGGAVNVDGAVAASESELRLDKS